MKKTRVRIKKKHVIHSTLFLFVGLFIITLFIFYFLILKDLPSPGDLSKSSISKSSQIYDRNNKLLYTIHGDRNQTFIPLSQIPKQLQQATIAIEDKDFYRHGAVDIRGIIRAFISTVFHRKIQGGSTLTQQLVKNSLLSPEQTITRKVKEVILSFATELIYSKDKILEMYLNQSPYGGTLYGVEAAALTYFGKHVKELNLAEMALIAVLPEAPSVFSPFGANPEYAKTRQEEILQKMYEQGYITKQQKDAAITTPLKYQKVSTTIQAPHFVLYAKSLLEDKYDKKLIREGGLKIKTSLDLDIQYLAESIVASEVAKLKNYKVSNGAALVTNPATGEILAMVGSKDYFNTEISGNVNVTNANRQPGSSIKPLNYATGLSKGYSAATPFVDTQTCFPNQGGKNYCPVNYDGKWHGAVSMRYSLGNSFNIPAVKMLKLNTVESMIATASAMGITSFKDPNRYGLSLTLGGGEVTMLEMATAYAVFANQGYRVNLHPILSITDSNDKIIEKYNPPSSPIFGKKVLPSAVAFIISDMLSDNNARSLAFGTNSELKIPKQIVAVKTGTTNDLRDNWTIGYTPSFVVVTWIGNNDNSPMSGVVSGVTGAAPMWNKIIDKLLKDKAPQPFQKPDTVISKVVCSTSGLLPPADGTADKCPTRLEYFVKGTEPKQVDPGKQKVFIDKTTQDLAKPGQTDNLEEKEHIIITDPTGSRYCLTCPRPELTPTKTQ